MSRNSQQRCASASLCRSKRSSANSFDMYRPSTANVLTRYRPTQARIHRLWVVRYDRLVLNGPHDRFLGWDQPEGLSGTVIKGKRNSYDKKRSSGIRVTVIKTGYRTKHCVLTASSMEQLMSQATEKLKSTTAIRQVFKIVNKNCRSFGYENFKKTKWDKQQIIKLAYDCKNKSL